MGRGIFGFLFPNKSEVKIDASSEIDLNGACKIITNVINRVVKNYNLSIKKGSGVKLVDLLRVKRVNIDLIKSSIKKIKQDSVAGDYELLHGFLMYFYDVLENGDNYSDSEIYAQLISYSNILKQRGF